MITEAIIDKEQHNKSPRHFFKSLLTTLAAIAICVIIYDFIFALHSVPGAHHTKYVQTHVSANASNCFINSATIDVKNRLGFTVFSYTLDSHLCTMNNHITYFDNPPLTGYAGDLLITVDHNATTAIRQSDHVQATGSFQISSGFFPAWRTSDFFCATSITLNEYADGHFRVDEHDCH